MQKDFFTSLQNRCISIEKANKAVAKHVLKIPKMR